MPREWINLAIQQAKKSDYKFRLGALAVKNNTICGRGHNTYRGTTKFLKNSYKYWSRHAETHALTKVVDADILIVVRLKKDGTLSMSKPCEKCQKFLKKKKVKKVYFTDWNGEIQVLKL